MGRSKKVHTHTTHLHTHLHTHTHTHKRTRLHTHARYTLPIDFTLFYACNMTTDAYQTDAYMTELKEMATQLKIQDSDLHPGGFASDGNLYTEREYVSTIWDETVRVCILRGRGVSARVSVKSAMGALAK